MTDRPYSHPPQPSKSRAFTRPAAHRSSVPIVKDGSKQRFEREALGGALWRSSCRSPLFGLALQKENSNGEVPDEFSTADDYIAIFDPLVLEEARESVRSEYYERCADGFSTRPVDEITALCRKTVGDGWATLKIKVGGKNPHQAMQTYRKRTVVVMTLGKPPTRNVEEWVMKLEENGTATNKEKALDRPDTSGPLPKKTKSENIELTKTIRNEYCPLDEREKSAETVPQPAEQVDSSGARSSTERAGIDRPAAAAYSRDDNDDENKDVFDSSIETGFSIKSQHSGGRIVAGLIQRTNLVSDGLELELAIHPLCERHASQLQNACDDGIVIQGEDGSRTTNKRSVGTELPPCMHVNETLQKFSQGWWIAPAGMLITSEREFKAVHAVKNLDINLLKYILEPSRLVEIGKHYSDDEIRRKMWPYQAAQPPFIAYLQGKYDYRQLEAIEMTACHLGSPPGSSTVSPKHPTLPFVLIQGPPGTGKTHTVVGVLNVWHLTAYQRYYDYLVQRTQGFRPRRVTRSAVSSNSNDPLQRENSWRSNPLDELAAGAGPTSAATSTPLVSSGPLDTVFASKPRILVCTPSNAACDELLSRVMSVGFCDGNGNIYHPNVVRVVSDESILTEEVKQRSLATLVRKYVEMPQPEWQKRRNDIGQQLRAAEREVAALEFSLEHAAADDDESAAMPPSPEMIGITRNLVERIQTVRRLRLEMEKLDKSGTIVWSSQVSVNRRERDEAVASLEEILLSEAEMVFATLSSTQRDVFKNAARKAPFHTVLIDEAGQSSEVATLQPLGFGARQVVLVGDPQQLPATILSEAGKAAAMERSLFERLQKKGCPVKLLTVQYRMDPEIRVFPSRHFYRNQLEDAEAVLSRMPAPYHSRRLLRQYVVFDVSHGKERRGQAGGSLSNYEEAEFAVCLYLELRRAMEEAAASAAHRGAPLPSAPSVAVITPYREQKALLQKTFQSLCSPDVLKLVSIQTIDSYQGRQVDVVILSCVRAQTAVKSVEAPEKTTDVVSAKDIRTESANATGIGLGFVNDVRRMNVAITRARRSLWVLGSIETLQVNQHWQALIRDAESRGCLERDAHARQLFPQVWRWVDERRVKINQEKSVSDPSIAYRVPGNRTNSAILRQVESKGKKQDMQTQQGKKNKGQGRRESKGGTIQRINRKAGATKNRHRESDFIPSWQKERR